MNVVLMLLFVLSTGGSVGTMALPYSSMDECEAAKTSIIMALSEAVDSEGKKAAWVAAACVVPIKATVV